MYTLEQLRKINSVYHVRHNLNEVDVQIVNDLIPRIERLRDTNQLSPHYGDRVVCVRPDGTVVDECGLLDKWTDERFSICTNLYSPPFISTVSQNISASGGPWINPLKEEFLREAQFFEKKLAWFKLWGRWGMQANGAIVLQAEVNYWKFVSKHF